MTVLIKMFWVHDGNVTVCHSRRCHVADCSIFEHQPQRKLGLQQLNTATDRHWAGQWVTISDVVWTAYQTNTLLLLLYKYMLLADAECCCRSDGTAVGCRTATAGLLCPTTSSCPSSHWSYVLLADMLLISISDLLVWLMNCYLSDPGQNQVETCVKSWEAFGEICLRSVEVCKHKHWNCDYTVPKPPLWYDLFYISNYLVAFFETCPIPTTQKKSLT